MPASFTRGRAAPRFYFRIERAPSAPLVILFSRSFLTPTLPPSFPPPPDVRLFTSARILYLYSSPLFPLLLSFFFSSLSFPTLPLRRLAINHGAVHQRCSRSNDSPSLSLPSIFIASRSRDLFHFVTPISKVVCRPLASTVAGGQPRGLGSADHRAGGKGRVKISRVPRPRDYGISPMVIYGPRREERKERAREPRVPADISYLHLLLRARLSTPAHGSRPTQPPCR